MKKFKVLLAIFAALAAQASLAGAQGVQLNFDGTRGIAGAASLKELVQASAPELVAAPKLPEAGRGGKWNSCQIVELDYRDGVSVNRRIDLSRNYPHQVCENVTITNSQGQSVTVNQCHTEYEFYSASAGLIVNRRELRPGEKERIEVCYDFQSSRGSFFLHGSPFEYTYVDKQNPPNDSYSVELFPGARKPQAPAAGALQDGGFAYDDVRGEFTLTLRNRLGAEYYGRKLHIGVELVQDKLFDSSLGVKFFEFPVNSYTGDFEITFKQTDFGSAKEAGEFRAKAKKYFVKWGYKVKGEGFTDAYVEGGKTEAVSVIQ